jgi:nucleoside-triphosphatase
VKNNIFVTGGRGTGKSTVIRKIIATLGITPSGFITISDKRGYEGVWALYLQDAGRDTPLFSDKNKAAVCRADGSWESYPDIFDSEGTKLLSFQNKPRLVIMDELGFMEKDARIFQSKVMEILDSPIPVIGAIKTVRDPFLDRVRNHPNADLFEVTPQNRDTLARDLAAMLGKMIRI